MDSPHPLADDLNDVVQRVGDAWEALRGGRLFVSGGTGFFGAWLLESFAWANQKRGLKAQALVLVRDRAAFLSRWPRLAADGALALWEGDVQSFAMPPGTFSHVMHLATGRSGELAPRALLDLIVHGTRRMLDCARQTQASRFLLASSGAVYGPQPAAITHLPEDYPGGPIEVHGDGTPYRSYLYAADLAAWLWTILLKGQPCRPYNVGSESALTIAELAAKIAAYFHTEVRIAQRPTAGAASQRHVPATLRARQELGLDAWTGLDNAIDRTVRWYKKVLP